MAEIERAVRKVMEVERVTIRRVPPRPTLPTTQPNLRYMMTPRMVRIEGVNTPPKVPKAWDLLLCLFSVAIRRFPLTRAYFLAATFSS